MNAKLSIKPDLATANRIDRQPKVVIVGAGMSGILSAIRLREMGMENIVVLEKADRIGGTWRDNTYPGLSCDVPAHMYTYSFAGNPEYSHRFAKGPEIFAYFDRVSKEYGIDKIIRFNSEVTDAVYCNGQWQLKTLAGDELQADIVLCATGVLHEPRYPKIDGLDSFAGEKWHTARWNHDVDISGKRVAVIGTGSTATQIVSTITEKVGKLTLFQRSAQWIYPLFDRHYTEKHKERLRKDLSMTKKLHDRYQLAFNQFFPKLVTGNKFVQWLVSWTCKRHLESKVKNPILREKLRPDYQAGCKRLIIANGFYEAIQSDNAELVTEGIQRIEPQGIRTADGQLRECDVLVLATGFHAHNFMRPMNMTGINDITLDEAWSKCAFAHKTVTVPGFPNVFLLTGPNSPIGNFSLIGINELQLDYITQLVEQWTSGKADEIEPKMELTMEYNKKLQNSMGHTIWVTGCKSWYFDEFGRLAMWPWSMNKFRQEMAAPKLEEFDLRKLSTDADVSAGL
ncbi:MAG: NAD(P)/FAD-dependent oxidoreductase [Gammaproteobacteria bacterium]